MKSAVLITFVRRLFHIRRTQRSFESPRYLLKWLLISTLIGLVAGIGAIGLPVIFMRNRPTYQITCHLPNNGCGEQRNRRVREGSC